MSTEFHHGVRVFEVDEGGATIRVVSTAIIGIVSTAPMADADAFPLNTPVLLTNPGGSIARMSVAITMFHSMAASPPVIMVLMPMPTGYMYWSVATSRGHRYWFQP